MSNNILPKGFALSIQKRSSDDASALSEKSTSTEQSSKRSRSEFPVLEGKPKAASSSNSLNSSVSPSGGSSSSSKSTVTESSPRKERSVISIDELMGDNPRLRNTVMFLILLRVVAPNMNSDMNPYTVKNFKKKNFTSTKNNYSRLFLCLDKNSPSGQTVYIGEGRGIGVNLWSKVASVRDNGTIGIGTMLVLYSPRPITKLLANETPIIETNSSLQVDTKRRLLEQIVIDFSVPEQTTRGFILNNAKLEIKMIEVVKTNCSGYFCDKQRSIEILKTDKKCGCYTMRGMGSNLAIVHVVKIVHEALYEDLQVDDFSSMKFSLLYLSEYFPKSTRRISYDVTNNEEELYDAIDQIVAFYNEHGGFTVAGWYKRGEIDDFVTDKTEKVSNSDVAYHVTSVYPSRYLNAHAEETKDMKFNVLNID